LPARRGTLSNYLALISLTSLGTKFQLLGWWRRKGGPKQMGIR
jgi:hypothetical protein